METTKKLLLAAAFLNALSWIILIPLWQYPDEQAHFAQVQNFAEQLKAQIAGNDTSEEIAKSELFLHTQRSDGINEFTYHPEYKIEYTNGYYGPHEQELRSIPKSARTNLVKKEATFNPPLYYILSSIPYKLFNQSSLIERVYASRLTSLVLFMLLVTTAFKVGEVIFKNNKIAQITLASIVAFKPMLVFASTGILPDILTNLLFALAFLICIKILTGGLKTIYVLQLAAVLILGFLTRQQFLLSLLFIIPSVLISLMKYKDKLRKLLPIILVTCAFLYLFSLIFPSLGFLRSFNIPEVDTFKIQDLFTRKFKDTLIWEFKNTLNQTLPWYWGVYKWLSLTLPPVVYQLINRLIFLSVIGLIAKIILDFKAKKLFSVNQLLIFTIFAAISYPFALIAWDSSFMFSHGFPFGLQGRYFFPLVIAHITILIFGFLQVFQLLPNTLKNYGMWTIIFLTFLFNDITLGYVSSSYYDLSNFNVFVQQASQYKPQILKGWPIIAVIGSSLIFQAIYLKVLFFKFRNAQAS